MGGIINRKIIIGFLIAFSAVITFLQLSQRPEVETVRALAFARDVAKGERIAVSDFVEINILPQNTVDNMIIDANRIAGTRAALNLPSGMIVVADFFETSDDFQPEEGNSMTAIKMLPDSAICWTTKSGSVVSVCFVDDKGEMTMLGEVKLLGVYDQRLGNDETPMFAVVEGKRNVIDQIIQRRALGRLEFLLKK